MGAHGRAAAGILRSTAWLLLVGAAGGCSDGPAEPTVGGCGEGQIATDTGACVPLGVPPEGCAAGFEPVAQQCEPILPAAPCPDGLLALPGDTECRELAPCGSGTWGEIPVDSGTQYVDPGYPGQDSDGSAERPWTGIDDAYAAAQPSSLIALGAGSYAGPLAIQGKPIRLWGRCPAQVEIVAPAGTSAAVDVGPGASGTELHNLALRGPSLGLTVSGARDVVVEGLWVHDTSNYGIDVEDPLGPASLQARRVLIERASQAGFFVGSADVDVEDVVIRDTKPNGDDWFGRGMSIEGSPPYEVTSHATLRRIVIQRNPDAGIAVQGSELSIEACVIQDIVPQVVDGHFGRGIDIQSSTATVESCVVQRVVEHGINVSLDADVRVESTVIRDVESIPSSGARGVALSAYRSQLTAVGTAVSGCRSFGMGVVDGRGRVERSLFLDTTPGENGLLGDGLVAATIADAAQIDVVTSYIARSARAGVANFGGTVAMGNSRFECNTIDLDGEESYGSSFTYTDHGGNACGCGQQNDECQVLTADLAPPDFGP